MPERSDRDWLNDILDEIALARQLTQSMDYDKFGADPFERLQASSRRRRLQLCPMCLGPTFVWRTATDDLPELEAAIRNSRSEASH